MKNIYLFIKNQGIISIAILAAIALIALSLFSFNVRVDDYIRTDMRSQIEAIQNNSTGLIQNELNYLKRITQSAANLISQAKPQADDDITALLKDYSVNSNIVRALFITPDGDTYTSYAGYLGRRKENAFIDGTPLSEISNPVFSTPYFASELNEVIFEVACPARMGEKQGVLVSSYNISRFNDILKNDFIGGSAEIGVLNRQGNVVVGKNVEEFNLNVPDSLSRVKFSNSSAEEMRRNLAKGVSGFSSYYVQNVERYCSYAPVELNDWYVIVMVTENSLRSALSQLEKYGLRLTFELLTVMITLLLIIITARYKEQKKVQTILQKSAMIDGLTGIYNRATAEDEISKFLNKSDKKENFALLIIDVDNFKSINDTWGHLFGDCVLTECASRLKDVFDKKDIIGRIGGDEFVVLIKSYTEEEEIYERIRRLLDDLHAYTNSGDKKKISLSVGIALSGEDNNSFNEMYQRADESLYRAKDQGKGRFSL